MDRRPLDTRSHFWVPKLALALVRAGLKPNQVSVLSVFAAGLAGAAFYYVPRWPLLLVAAAVCIQLRLLFNMLDGVMAVEGGLKSKTGDLFNDIPDRLADVLILLGAGYGTGCPALGWAASVLAVSTAYLRLLGGALGLPQDFCGPMAKPHRMFWLTLGALGELVEAFVFHRGCLCVLKGALALVVVGAAITCVRRSYRLYRAMEAR